MSWLDSVFGALPTMGGVLLTSAVVAAGVTFVQNLWLERRRIRELERTRLRQSFAEAFAVYSDYKEFPYAIRRRRLDQPAEERARLSEELRAIQSKVSYYRVWTLFESPEVGAAYSELLGSMRSVAGKAMKAAWVEPPAQTDAQMNVSLDLVDLRSLKANEDQFVTAVAKRLDQLAPIVVRRK